MLVRIDAAKDQPIYAQIADSVRTAVSVGELKAGEKLPPADDVAIGLGVNKHTVLRAYQELRDEGLIDLRRGRGAVVTQLADGISELHLDAQRLVARAERLGVAPATLASMVTSVSTTSIQARKEDTE